MEPSNSPSGQTSPNDSVRPTRAQKVYQALGFRRGYAFILCMNHHSSLSQNNVHLADNLVSGVIFGGCLFGFGLSRLPWLDIYGKLCPPVPMLNLTTAMPSLCYSIRTFKRYEVAIILHLATCLPAAILAVFQFVPIIRHRFILYHRLAGYTAVLLMSTSLIGACMLADAAMGGMLLF
jgi:hypothetical protein